MLPEWVIFIKEIEAKKPNLQGASLGNTKLIGANLSGSDLTDADLSIAYLIRANLSKVDLTNADLSGAVLSEANLQGANLKDTDLEETYLNGADLTGASNLTCDQLDLTNFDKDTRFPEYIQISWSPDGNFTCCEK